jgi:hypothetical protein
MTKSNKKFITSVIDVEEHERREAALTQAARASSTKPGQPPMVDRLREVMILSDRLETDGIPFATARDSRMNKEVREWLHERSKQTPDQRKSRRKKVGRDAVQNILKQIKKIRKSRCVPLTQDHDE